MAIFSAHFRFLFKRFVFLSLSLSSYIRVVLRRVSELAGKTKEKLNRIRKEEMTKTSLLEEIVDRDSEQMAAFLPLSHSYFLQLARCNQIKRKSQLENSFSRHLSRLPRQLLFQQIASCILLLLLLLPLEAVWEIRISRWLFSRSCCYYCDAALLFLPLFSIFDYPSYYQVHSWNKEPTKWHLVWPAKFTPH